MFANDLCDLTEPLVVMEFDLQPIGFSMSLYLIIRNGHFVFYLLSNWYKYS